LVALAKGVMNLPHLDLEGFTFYPGHIKVQDEKGHEDIAKLSALVESITHDFRKAGLPHRIISGGSTPALFHSHKTGVNEIRPGTYIFNDRNTVECGAATWEQCAATILATVVSTARPGHMIIDGGSKTFSTDRLVTGEATFGVVTEARGALFHKMNEEHGYIDLRRAEKQDFQVGEKVRVIPNHICVAMNLHEHVYGIRGGDVVENWKVEARGKLQ
jgi:D-serine deaminase-like pyridoxal phosphate-dependent protein